MKYILYICLLATIKKFEMREDRTLHTPQGLYTPRDSHNILTFTLVHLITHRLDNHTYMLKCSHTHSFTYIIFHSILSAPPAILNAMPKQDIHLGHTSLIKCEVDRGSPLAYIHWLHVQYHNETGQETLTEITNSSDPRFTIVSDGLQITNVQHSDEGIYRCYVYNSYGTVIRDIQAAIGGLH